MVRLFKQPGPDKDQQNLNNFAIRMEKLANGIPQEVAKLQRIVWFSIHNLLMIGTPIDTGQARSNWLPGVGAPETGTRPSLAEGKGGSTGAKVTAVAQAEVFAKGKEHKAGQDLFLTNNLDYIKELNDEGKSPQGSLFVERAIALGKDAIDDARIDIARIS